MKIRIVATTDIGKERTNNEDAFIICPDLSQQDWDRELHGFFSRNTSRKE